MFWGSLLRLLSFHIPAEHHKTVSTVMSTASVTGYILSWSILGKAFAGLSWKAYFIAPGFCALLLIPCWLLTARRHPMEQMLRERRETPPSAGLSGSSSRTGCTLSVCFAARSARFRKAQYSGAGHLFA